MNAKIKVEMIDSTSKPYSPMVDWNDGRGWRPMTNGARRIKFASREAAEKAMRAKVAFHMNVGK